jgi:phage gp29-like protein
MASNLYKGTSLRWRSCATCTPPIMKTMSNTILQGHTCVEIHTQYNSGMAIPQVTHHKCDVVFLLQTRTHESGGLVT